MGISKEEKNRRDELFEQGLKICSTCNRILSVDNFGKKKNGAYGLNSECKECKNDRDKKYHQEHREEHLLWSREYVRKNREKVRQYKHNYYIEHQDEVRAYNQIYRQEHRDEMSTYFHEYYLEHIDEVKMKSQEWSQTESGKLSHRNANRRRKARMKNIEGDHSKEELLSALEFFDYKCAYSGEPLEEEYHIDHIIPVSKGGTNYIWNIVPANSGPNISKRDLKMEYWFRKQPYFSEERLQKIYEWIELQKNLKENDNKCNKNG